MKTKVVKKATKAVETKTAETKAADTTKTAAVEAVAEVKEEVKTETKTAAKKAAAKTTKAAAKTEEIKETVKKAPAKKAAVKNSMTLQFAGKDYTEEDLMKIAKDVWRYDLKNKVGDLKSVELYVKPEESLCYYVMNGDVTGSFAI